MKVTTKRTGKKVERGCLGKEGVKRKEAVTEGVQETSGFLLGLVMLILHIYINIYVNKFF